MQRALSPEALGWWYVLIVASPADLMQAWRLALPRSRTTPPPRATPYCANFTHSAGSCSATSSNRSEGPAGISRSCSQPRNCRRLHMWSTAAGVQCHNLPVFGLPRPGRVTPGRDRCGRRRRVGSNVCPVPGSRFHTPRNSFNLLLTSARRSRRNSSNESSRSSSVSIGMHWASNGSLPTSCISGTRYWSGAL